MNLLAGFLIFLSSLAFGYQEKIETTTTGMRGSWVSESSGSVSAMGPIRGYFNVSTENFDTPDCSDFTAKVRILIQDWENYSKLNMYSLTFCSMVGNKMTTVFFYGIDLWRQDGIKDYQDFLKDHQGMKFEGHTLDFSPVRTLMVRSDLIFAERSGTKLTPVHSGSRSQIYQYEDLWYPDYLTSVDTISQDGKAAILNYIESKFGAKEKAAFEIALGTSNYINLGDYFTLTLENGKIADMWLGFGANKDCGKNACYPSDALR